MYLKFLLLFRLYFTTKNTLVQSERYEVESIKLKVMRISFQFKDLKLEWPKPFHFLLLTFTFQLMWALPGAIVFCPFDATPILSLRDKHFLLSTLNFKANTKTLFKNVFYSHIVH
jgi:hypothetical protein